MLAGEHEALTNMAGWKHRYGNACGAEVRAPATPGRYRRWFVSLEASTKLYSTEPKLYLNDETAMPMNVVDGVSEQGNP